MQEVRLNLLDLLTPALREDTSRAEQIEAGPFPVQVPSFAFPPPRIQSEILHSLPHPNCYSFCNITMLAYAVSLYIIGYPTPKLCQCRNRLRAWTNTIRFALRTWLSSLSPDGQNWC